VEAVRYAIRKEIHNKPIVHAIDKARQRELWHGVGVTLLAAAIVLFVVWQHDELRQQGYQMVDLQKECAKQERLRRELRLEIERLRAPKRVEEIARGPLRLVPPEGDDAVIVERVVPPAPPASSVVAARRP
jgi:cell division protein FtsL